MNRTSSLLAGLLLGASSAVCQVFPTGREQIGCGSAGITLQVTNGVGSVTFSPMPAGFGQITGFYLIYIPSPANVLPPVLQFLPWGSAPFAPCCHPGPAIMYLHNCVAISPIESWTVPLPPGVGSFGLTAWVQALLWRPPQGVPCQTYVTNQVEVVL